MSEITIYHNPRCSKSRATLALIEEAGITPNIVLYLETPPSSKKIRQLLRKLGLRAERIVRSTEEIYKTLELKGRPFTEAQWCALMAAHPKLMERPIVETETAAVIGRPPSNVLELLN